VKVHRSHIMKKMGARSVADLVRMAEALGVNAASSQH
jgi:FixJ family two-component response regulator